MLHLWFKPQISETEIKPLGCSWWLFCIQESLHYSSILMWYREYIGAYYRLDIFWKCLFFGEFSECPFFGWKLLFSKFLPENLVVQHTHQLDDKDSKAFNNVLRSDSCLSNIETGCITVIGWFTMHGSHPQRHIKHVATWWCVFARCNASTNTNNGYLILYWDWYCQLSSMIHGNLRMTYEMLMWSVTVIMHTVHWAIRCGEYPTNYYINVHYYHYYM